MDKNKTVSQSKALIAVGASYLIGATTYALCNGDLFVMWFTLKLLCSN